MADFDPYYQWLAIPPKDQPPNHYRLLGVDLFEPNPDAIENAADQRMTHVRSFQTGKYSDLSQKLLNEIAAAKICLLSPEKRTAYDAQLQQMRRQSAEKKPVWLGLGLLAGAALVLGMLLAVVLIVTSKKDGKEVASAEPKPPPAAATPAEPKSVNPAPQEGLKEPAQPAEPRTGPPDVPPKEAVKPNPSADSGKPGGTSPQRPADPTPSTAGTTRPQPAGDSQPPPPKGPSSIAEKPKSPKPEERPHEKPAAVDTVAHPEVKPQTPDTPAQPKVKPAAPDGTTVKQALATIRETYQGDYRAAEQTALVQKLLEKAEESRGDLTARFALLEEASKLAAEAWQGELAFEIIDVMASEYRIPAAAMKAEIIEQAAKKPRSLQQRKAVAAAALEVLDEAIAADDFDAAREMGKQAMLMARPTKDRELIQETVTKTKDIEVAAKASDDAKEAMAKLKADPGDPDANAILGKHLCLTKGDWEKGLPLLARGGNAALKALAERDIQGAATAEAQVRLGDAWWLARGRQRAVSWYEKAILGLTGLERDRVAGRVLSEPFGNRPVDLLAWATPDRNDLDDKWGKWARTGAGVACLSFPPLTEGRQDDCSTLALPVEVSGQYELLVSFTRDRVGAPGRDEILIDFPVGLHNCAFVIGESGSGLGNIDGKNCYRNSTTTSKAKLVDGRRCAILLKVHRVGNSAAIDVALDNQPFIHWSGSEESLSKASPYIQQAPASRQRFFLSTRSLATFHSAELRVVSGRAKWMK